MATTYCMSHAPDSFYADRRALYPPSSAEASSCRSASPSFQWQSPSITLASLRGLAESLNPGDLELTPVQAFFELAERYPPETLLEPGLLDRLKKELCPVVRCVAYGSSMDREAFESVVRRVFAEFAPDA